MAIVSTDSMGCYHVRSTNGNTRVGGAKLLEGLVAFCLRQLKKMGTPLSDEIVCHLRVACEKAKIELSKQSNTQIIVSDEISIEISLDQYNKLISPFIDQTMTCVEYALKDADLEASDIDKIVLIGGVTYTPLIRSKLENVFKKPVSDSINPMEAGKYFIHLFI